MPIDRMIAYLAALARDEVVQCMHVHYRYLIMYSCISIDHTNAFPGIGVRF